LGSDKRLHQRAIGRIRMELDRAVKCGAKKLIISDENMLGSLRHNIDNHSFYKDLSTRLARLTPALGGADLNIGLAIRSYDTYWASVIGKRLMAGFSELDADALDLLVTQPRRWTHVVKDISRELPEAELTVWPYECWGGQPGTAIAKLLGIDTADLRPAAPNRVNTSRDAIALNLARVGLGCPLTPVSGQYMPFNDDQCEKLRGDYANDLKWLAQGAGGRAIYLAPREEIFDKNGWAPGAPRHKKTTINRAQRPDDKGRSHDRQEARMG
jgi:hypothetical protein